MSEIILTDPLLVGRELSVKYTSTELRCGVHKISSRSVPGGAIKRDPERENCALLTIAAQTANSIHIRVTFNVATRY